MFADYEPRPLWFATEELLTNVFRAEINAMMHLLAVYPDLPNLFDVPAATIPQRTACFALLAHRKLVDMIDETFIGRYEESPSLGDEDSKALRSARNLVARDAPAWVLEINDVVEGLPWRIYDALPEPLRKGGFGFNPDNAEQMQAIQSTKNALSSVEEIQALTERVLDQQLERLRSRWSATPVQVQRSQKPRGRRTRDKERMLRDKMIAQIDDVAETIGEFLKLMDERKVKPQPTWSGWPGSWPRAYRDPRLRKLIHKDKSRALTGVENNPEKREGTPISLKAPKA